jgi:hypothetical protein
MVKVEDVYTPYVQKSVNTTFAGNKFNSSSSDPSQKFDLDLNSLRLKNKEDKKQSQKQEFPIQVDRELESKFVKIRDDPNLFTLKQQPSTTQTAPPKQTVNAQSKSLVYLLVKEGKH